MRCLSVRALVEDGLNGRKTKKIQYALLRISPLGEPLLAFDLVRRDMCSREVFGKNHNKHHY